MQAIDARLIGGPAHGRVVRLPLGCTEWHCYASNQPVIGDFWRDSAITTIDLRAEIVTYRCVGAFNGDLLLTCDPAIAAVARISVAALVAGERR